MATTEERMMIMGLCLQGILANPNLTGAGINSAYNPKGSNEHREELVKLAHQFADKLCPPPEGARRAADIVDITRVAHAAMIAAGYAVDNDEDQSFVFQTVRIFYEDREREAITPPDRIVKAIVDASRPAVEELQPELFGTEDGLEIY